MNAAFSREFGGSVENKLELQSCAIDRAKENGQGNIIYQISECGCHVEHYVRTASDVGQSSHDGCYLQTTW
jgi:hypothetical protein